MRMGGEWQWTLIDTWPSAETNSSSAKEETGSRYGYCNLPTGWYIATIFKPRYFPEDRLISQRTEFHWPPYSPDLNPPDFFLWRYLTERIHAKNPQFLQALKINTRGEVRNIPTAMIARVTANFNVWVTAVIQQRRALTVHIINYWNFPQFCRICKDKMVILVE